jgi:guanylate kinase
MNAASSRAGRLFVIAAPSGAGKTSLVHALLARAPSLRFSTSFTTRERRPTEIDGKDYFFVDRAEFDRMVAAGDFLEHADVFGNCYGTSAVHVDELIRSGHSVLLEIDWQGARQIRDKAPGAISIFILPPDIAELERRLRGRATDAEAVISRRLAEAVDDMHHWPEFDYVVVNDDFGAALDALARIIAGDGAECSTLDPAHRARIETIVPG